MGKDMVINILQEQLMVANNTTKSMSASMRSMSATIDELRKQIASLESLLKDRDDSLGKANAQMRGLKATFLPKQSEKQTAAAPKTDEQKAAPPGNSIFR